MWIALVLTVDTKAIVSTDYIMTNTPEFWPGTRDLERMANAIGRVMTLA